MSFFDIPVGQTIKLPAMGTWPESIHVFDDETVLAIQTAMAAQRPLLIRGEPGTGKSQLARAVAIVLQRLFISAVVNARMESQDLMWHFDTLARLGEAQIGNQDAQLESLHYLSPGALWWAFDYASAAQQYQRCRYRQLEPEPLAGWQAEQGCVVLIDEIDKADAELPNGLLEILGNGAFSVPHLNRRVGLTGSTLPLVIITTNEERELPAAFVRRCMVLRLSLPTEQQALMDWLVQRGACHFAEKLPNKVLLEAARLLAEDREKAQRLGLNLPGQAEYIDLLRALVELADGEQAQLEVLRKISGFAFEKYTSLE